MFILITISIFILGLVVFIEYIRIFDKKREFFLFEWTKARDERYSWIKKHSYGYDFNDSEYQKLFEIEIGAEILYLIHTDFFVFPSKFQAISWSDYVIESNHTVG